MLNQKESDQFREDYLILEDVYDFALAKMEDPELGVDEDLWVRELKMRKGSQYLKYFQPRLEKTLTLAIQFGYISEIYYDFDRYFKRVRLIEYMRDPENPRPKNYGKYLDSPAWSNLRKHILERDGYLCICGRKATEVHHKTYERTGKEYLSDLVSLCELCHRLVHLLRDRDKEASQEPIEYRL